MQAIDDSREESPANELRRHNEAIQNKINMAAAASEDGEELAGDRIKALKTENDFLRAQCEAHKHDMRAAVYLLRQNKPDMAVRILEGACQP